MEYLQLLLRGSNNTRTRQSAHLFGIMYTLLGPPQTFYYTFAYYFMIRISIIHYKKIYL